MTAEIVKDRAGKAQKVILTEPRGHSAVISLYGGQVVSWKNDEDEDFLFMSKKAVFSTPPTPIRGGIALSFPMAGYPFGSLVRYNSASNSVWSIEENPHPLPVPPYIEAFVDLILKFSPEETKAWPHSDIRIEGLGTLYYWNNVQDKSLATEGLDAVTFDEDKEVDRIYLDKPSQLHIIDSTRQREFILSTSTSLPDAVVWNPWTRNSGPTWSSWSKKSRHIKDLGRKDYEKMVCVGGAAIEPLIQLEPGKEWRARQEIVVAEKPKASMYEDNTLKCCGCFPFIWPWNWPYKIWPWSRPYRGTLNMDAGTVPRVPSFLKRTLVRSASTDPEGPSTAH